MPDVGAATPRPKATYTPGASADVAGSTDPAAASRTYVPVPLTQVDGVTPVPTYTADASEDPFYQWIARRDEIGLPVTAWPWEDDWKTDPVYLQRARIVHAFHAAVWTGNTDVAREMVTRGLVTPETVSVWGTTALVLAVSRGRRVARSPCRAVAVSRGDTRMVKFLVALGADVNQMCAAPHTGNALTDTEVKQCGTSLARGGRYYDPSRVMGRRGDDPYYPQRTALMVAADQGRIALVKLLCSLGADPAVVAPDGQIALRIAAAAGHREVVDYLPATRKGAWLRWKTAHTRTIQRFRGHWAELVGCVKLFVWTLPKALFWHLPRACWSRISSLAKRAWARRAEIRKRLFVAGLPIGRGIKTVARGVWHGTRVLSRHLWRAIKNAPRWMVATIVALPDILSTLILTLWLAVCAYGAAICQVLASLVSLVHTSLQAAISLVHTALKAAISSLMATIVTLPDRLYNLALTLRSAVCAIIAAIGHVFTSLVSLVHTTLVAAISFLRRATLADVWAGVRAVLRAVFVGLPALHHRGRRMLSKAILETIKKGGIVGKVLGYAVMTFFVPYILLLVILWVPICIVSYAVEMLASVVRYGLYSVHEAKVWINPKY